MADLPDFFSPFVVKGWDGTEYKTLRVTSLGELYILLSALDGVTVTPLHCDAQGNAFFNVKAQDLAEVINRPKYGAAAVAEALINVTANAETTLLTVTGKGVIYAGGFFLDYLASQKDGGCKLVIDGESLAYTIWEEGIKYNNASPGRGVIIPACIDEVNFIYSAGLLYGITFEVSARLVYREANGGTPAVKGELWYALI